MMRLMKLTQDSINILRHAGESEEATLNLSDVALAFASLEKPDVTIEAYRQHVHALVGLLKAEGPATRLDDQLRLLRRVLVVQFKYQGEDAYLNDPRATNLMDVIDRRRGAPVALGLLYLHLADSVGWAMTGIDLGGEFLLRLSAADGSVVIDPFRAGQTCQIEEVNSDDLDEDEPPDMMTLLSDSRIVPASSELLRPLSKREVILRLQHQVKRRLLAQDKVDAAILMLQAMILFAPRRDELWRELGYLQAERGHLRAAITALEVVRDLTPDPVPLEQTDGLIRELRWRLN